MPTPGSIVVAPSNTRKIFISYSHVDYTHAKSLELKLRGLAKRFPLDLFFFDRVTIKPGDDWDKLIRVALEQADTFIILASDAFNASSYCCDIELARMFEREREGVVRVIGIPLHGINLATVSVNARPDLGTLADRQCIPSDDSNGRLSLRPINDWSDTQKG